MIRLKCPKCSATQSLDDSEAGQVGKCADCGAKFRVPAKKGATPGRPNKETAKSTAPAKRSRDNDDDEDDGDEDEKEAKRPKKGSKPKSKAAAKKLDMTTVIALIPCIILLGVGSIFINRLGIIVAAVSIVLTLACGLMVYRTSIKESTSQAVMAAAFFILAGASIGGTMLRDGIVETQRNKTREHIKELNRKSAAPALQVFPHI